MIEWIQVIFWVQTVLNAVTLVIIVLTIYKVFYKKVGDLEAAYWVIAMLMANLTSTLFTSLTETFLL